MLPQWQSTCHYIVNHYVKIMHVRLGVANNMHPLSWGHKRNRSKNFMTELHKKIHSMFYLSYYKGQFSNTPNVGLETTTLGLRVPCSTDWASRSWTVVFPMQFDCPGGSRSPTLFWSNSRPRTKICPPRYSAPSTHPQNYITLYVAFTVMVVFFEGRLYAMWSLTGGWGYNRKGPI